MKLLHEAIRGSDNAQIFDNSFEATSAPRLIVQTRGRALSQLIEPVPAWVEHFVLSPLKMG
jgi:hypothetical protein